MRSLVIVCASAAALLAASPAFANCNSDIARVERSVDGLRSGPNTRAALRELDRAKASRSESACHRHVRQAATYADRSARADRSHRVSTRSRSTTGMRSVARYDERPN
jgi:hypothetical protein